MVTVVRAVCVVSHLLFSPQIISVTGFVDNDRDDLKLMAYLAGAKYTGYLCRSNTVLICKE